MIKIEIPDTNITVFYRESAAFELLPYYEVWTNYVEDPRLIGRISHTEEHGWLGVTREWTTLANFASMTKTLEFLEKRGENG